VEGQHAAMQNLGYRTALFLRLSHRGKPGFSSADRRSPANVSSQLIRLH